MIAQFLSVLYLFFITSIVGSVVSTILKWKINLILEILLGISVLNGLFTIYSIFLPVNLYPILALSALVIIYCLFNYRFFKKLLKKYIELIKNQIVLHPLISLFSFIIITISFFASMYSPLLHRDTGLYHLQAIKWIQEYPAVPGLANLHTRFGFNSNIFSLFAGFSFNWIFGQNIYTINFFLFSVIILWFIMRVQHNYLNKNYILSLSYLIAIFLLYIYCFGWISTTTPDIPCTLITIIIFLILVENDISKDSYRVLFILCIYVLTIKLTTLPILLIGMYLFIKKKYYTPSIENIAMVSIAVLIVIPWLIKNVITTGWLLFPFEKLDLFSFDWKVPVNDVIETKRAITAYARNVLIASENSSIISWVPNWIRSQPFGNLIMLVASFTFVLSGIIIAFKKNFKDDLFRLSLITSLIGMVYWFILAPDFRFGFCFLLPGLILPAKIIHIKNKYQHAIFISLTLLFMGLFLYKDWVHPWHFYKRISRFYLLPYPVERIDYGKTVYYEYEMLNDHISYAYPVGTNLCFDYPLPCAECIKPDLELRRDKIKYGFKSKLMGGL